MKIRISTLVPVVACAMLAQAEELRPLEVVRLPAERFVDVPAEVRAFIAESKCLVPQPADRVRANMPPVNVTRGEFARAGQTDWAILCSRDEKSSIVVFWGGPTRCATPIFEQPDSNFFQGIGDGVSGFSREIDTISAQGIRRTYELDQKIYGWTVPDVDHDGIDDAFVDKVSSRYYCEAGAWKTFAGAD